MTYTLSIPIEAPTMTVAQAIAWRVLNLLPSGTAFAIKAQPPAEGGQGDTPKPQAGQPWTQSELADIAAGIVSPARRNDPEYLAAVKAKAEGGGK